MLAALGKLMSSRKKTRMKIFPSIKKAVGLRTLMTRAAWLDGTLDKVEEGPCAI